MFSTPRARRFWGGASGAGDEDPNRKPLRSPGQEGAGLDASFDKDARMDEHRRGLCMNQRKAGEWMIMVT